MITEAHNQPSDRQFSSALSNKILIAGHYGFRNAGDEAILSAMLASMRSQRPELEFVVVSGNPGETAARHSVRSVLYNDLNGIIEAARQCNLIILGGGGIFHDYFGFDPDTLLTGSHLAVSFFSTFPLLATILDKPLMMSAVGVGPLLSDAGRHYTFLAFDQSWIATVRDIESRELMLSLGMDEARIKVTADPAHLIIPSYKESAMKLIESEGFSPSGERFIAVALRNWDIGVEQEKWSREVANALDSIIERYKAEVLFLPFQRADEQSTDDYAISNSVRSLMRNQSRTFVLERDYTPEERLGIYAHCEIVLGMRLHSIILAANARVPVIGLVYDPKVRNVMRQLGCEKYAIDLSAASAVDLLGLFEDAYRNRKKISANLQSAGQTLRQLANQNCALALDLLDNPARYQPALSREIVDLLKGTTIKLALRAETNSQTIQTLERKKEEELRELSYRQSEREHVVNQLTVQLAKQEETLQSLSARMREQEQEMQTLASQGAKAEQTARDLSQQLATKERDAQVLSQQLATKERDANFLSGQLSAKDYELRKITNTLAWRLLSRYGRIKYKYLLPIYRALGLPPYNRKTVTNQTNRLPVDHLPDKGGATLQLAADSARQEQLCKLIESNNYDIFCLPIIDWDFRFQRPQQLMSRFASAGHRVFYLSQEFRSSGEPYVIVEKSHNVYEVSLCGQPRNVYMEALNDRSRDELFNTIDALRRDLSLGATVAFVQLPFWWPLAEKTRAEFAWPIVYDCMDYHAGFSTNQRRMVESEHALLASADLVIVSSSFLETEATDRNTSVLLVRNACDYEHFAKANGRRGARPVVGYYGAIADWFDSDLVADIAERRPDWDFVLVGSTFSADTRRLSKLPNVALPGEKPYSAIPDWLATFDVAIIPFKRIPLTEATNPVKAYEILASGKPLVSVPIPEMTSLVPFVRLASTAEEFEREISEVLEDDQEDLRERRRAFARDHTWEKRFETLAPAVQLTFPKVSIIIVTFNNLALNRLCLESLYARTEWPNFEVIVVDNASEDGTQEYLLQAEKSFPNLRVNLNKKNLGFAGGNNIGLKQAAGEYLVLLNNDTVLTRGWLSTLIRRLHSDPKIGLIGPVTNAIANEAKVNVSYESIEDMPFWAAAYVRQNDGKVFPISMLAMFCVAMRKQVFEEVGLLDERFEVGMFEDDDYCRRVRERGYDLVCARDSFIHHWQRASFRLLGEEEYLRIYHENRSKYEMKWTGTSEVQSRPVQWHTTDNTDREQLEEVLARIRSSKGAVIFLPSIGWNVHLFQRPHHLAQTFARNGYVSIFDSSNAQDGVEGFKEIEPNLFLFHGPEDALHEISDPIIWAFPYNFDRTDTYPRSARIVYDWIDALEVFPYGRAFLERNHERGLREATLVAAVTRQLHAQAQAVRPDSIYLPNAVEYERFANDTVQIPNDAVITDLLHQGKPIAGYYGALAEWFNYQLLEEVARLRPDWNFLLIGQALDESIHRHALIERTNVKWIGPRDYETLPGYLRLFDVAIIPFAINVITKATSPLKLYEYMAGGRPIITTPLPECESFDIVNIARDAREFADLLDKARKQAFEPQFRDQLRRIALNNSWGARIATVIENLFVPNEQKLETEPVHSHACAASMQFTSDGPTIDQLANLRTENGQPSPDASVMMLPEKESGDSAARIAARFGHFRTPNNTTFFNALASHFSSIETDQCLPMYFEFAVSCNNRGRAVAQLLRHRTAIAGKRYLDVGCAYGGFLVAFAEEGAQAVGIDIDEMLINLARSNLRDNQLDVPLLIQDATRADQLQHFGGRFDIVTCNDVIEHVEDPQVLLNNVAAILRDDGIAYFEIPNRNAPRHVMSDGHYQLFGITLLDYNEAREYYAQHAPGRPYGVRHYLVLDRYREMFELAGLHFEVLEDNFQDSDLNTVLIDLAALRETVEIGLNNVPISMRPLVLEQVRDYLREIEAYPRHTKEEKRDFILRYGAGFWRVLGRKVSGYRN